MVVPHLWFPFYPFLHTSLRCRTARGQNSAPTSAPLNIFRTSIFIACTARSARPFPCGSAPDVNVWSTPLSTHPFCKSLPIEFTTKITVYLSHIHAFASQHQVEVRYSSQEIIPTFSKAMDGHSMDLHLGVLSLRLFILFFQLRSSRWWVWDI